MHEITAVAVVGEFRLRLTFDDGTVGEVDFADREWRGVLKPLTDPAYLSRVRVDPELGTVAWPDASIWLPSPSTRKHAGIALSRLLPLAASPPRGLAPF